MLVSGSGVNGVSGAREYIHVHGMNVCATDRLYKSASSYKVVGERRNARWEIVSITVVTKKPGIERN